MTVSAYAAAFTAVAVSGCAAAAAVLAIYSVRLIRRQIRLFRSIRLVELKSPKVRWWVLLGLTALAAFYAITQLFDPAAPEATLLEGRFSLPEWQYNLTLSSVVVLLAALAFFLLVLAFSRSAVVDRGVYCGCRFYDWYHVHDYLIDEEKGVVVLSANKYTFQTLMSTTPPLKVAKNDIQKLKFILSKNKNKFSGFVSETL